MKNLVLIGYMGSGKTTIADYLAKHENFQMIDTDMFIEKKEHQRISDIFATQGEAYFRQRETENIKELIERCGHLQNIVFSTGGGLPVKEENRHLLKQLGIVVFLKISADAVFERLKNDTTRPLLQCDNPMERIENMLKERNPVYEDAADIMIEVDHQSSEEIVRRILKQIKAM